MLDDSREDDDALGGYARRREEDKPARYDSGCCKEVTKGQRSRTRWVVTWVTRTGWSP